MGTILTLSGPSGVGKTTIAKLLLAKNSHVKVVQSVTTRPPRQSDMYGEYRHVSPGEFETMDRRNTFLWTTEYAGLRYGTRKESVAELFQDRHAIGVMFLVPDVLPILEGYLGNFPSLAHAHVKVFVTAPRTVLEQRLVVRRDDPKSVRRKLDQSSTWETLAKYARPKFHFVNNDRDSKETVAEVEELLSHHHS